MKNKFLNYVAQKMMICCLTKILQINFVGLRSLQRKVIFLL